MTSTPIIINVLESDGYKNKHPRTNANQVVLLDGTRLQSYLSEAIQFYIIDGKLTYKDPTTGAIKQVIQDPLSLLPLGNVTNAVSESLSNLANIKWTDPADVVIESSTGSIKVTEWKGTKVVIKEGSVPNDVNDGTLLLNSTVRNQYSNTVFDVPNLQENKVYFIKFFPYTVNDVVTSDDVNVLKIDTSMVSLDAITDYTASQSGTALFIRLTDPADKTGTYKGQVLPKTTWVKTKVLYKEGSAPTDHTDGVLITEYTERGKYSTVGSELVARVPVGLVFISVYILDDNDKWILGTVASYNMTPNALSDVTSMSVSSVEGTASVKWSDPADVVFNVGGNNHVTGRWLGTKIVRKVGSVPESVNDGVLIKDSKVRNEHSVNALTDGGLTDKTTYFYRAFPYSDEGAMTNSSFDHTIITLKDDTSGSPGSSILVAGDKSAGFFGEVPNEQLITPVNLTSTVGITIGTAQNNDTPWLKFIIDGTIIFVSKRTIRHTLSWNDLNYKELVKGTKIINISGINYRVRLMKGALTDPTGDGANHDRGAIGSEWNRLMIPIHEKAATGNWLYPHYAGPGVPNWGIGYTDADLLIHHRHGGGSASWCQEAFTNGGHILRGYDSVEFTDPIAPGTSSYFYGWRPVLELVQ